jgi:hypothetical protein
LTVNKDEQGKRHLLVETHFSRRLIMASTMKDKVADAGHAVVDAAKNVGHKVAAGAEKAVDKVEQVSPPMPRGKPGLGHSGLVGNRTRIEPGRRGGNRDPFPFFAWSFAVGAYIAVRTSLRRHWG